jgi:hypothetical protein
MNSLCNHFLVVYYEKWLAMVDEGLSPQEATRRLQPQWLTRRPSVGSLSVPQPKAAEDALWRDDGGL